VLKLVADAGAAYLEYQRDHLRNLTCKRIQCDEIWSFVYAKQKNIPHELWGKVRGWRRMDMDGNRCGYQACTVLVCRNARSEG